MFKKLSKSVREYKRPALLTPLMVILEVGVEIIIPLLMAGLIDKGIDKGNMSVVTKYGIVLLIVALVGLLLGYLAGCFSAKASCGFARNLRKDMFYNIQTFSFSNIDSFSISSLITRLTTDVTNVQMAFQMIIRMAIRAPIMLIFSLTVCFNISAKLSLIYLACMPVMIIGLLIIMRHAHPIFNRVFKKYDRLNNVVQENVKGIRVVKSFNQEEYEKTKFKTISNDVCTDFSKAEKTLAWNMPLVQFCMYACMLLISWFGARLIVSSGQTALTTGELLSLFTYTIQILSSLMMLSMVLVMITMSKASAKRIVEVLDTKSDITNPASPVTSVKDGSVEFDNVDFVYARNADKKCLDDVNLKIRSGETVGILGATGSSKTTLVQLIPRLYDTTSGTVKVGGVDVKDYDLMTLRDSVSMVLQKNELFSGSIKDNLRWGNEEATDEQIIKACQLAQADSFIETFPDKYDTHIEQGGANVSGGQKQRLCIARALLKNPKILILDDSTSAVDTKTDALIRQAFIHNIPDTTKIIIAQRVSSVMDADKIVVLDDGKIVACGKHDELMKSCDIYREVYESQQKAGAING